MDELKKYIREIPNFPKPGILFYDITTLWQDPAGFGQALDMMEKFVRSKNPTRLVSLEARGFTFGGALADRLKLPFIPARKPGKLPHEAVAETYDLEYGTDTIEIHRDAVSNGDRVVIVDDLIATGGTALAACKLVEKLGGEVVGVSAVIDLSFLPWREKLTGYDVNYLVSYDSESLK